MGDCQPLQFNGDWHTSTQNFVFSEAIPTGTMTK